MPERIDIETPQGNASSWLFAPENASKTGVLVFMDIFGVRPALFEMCERMALLGHNVLLPDLYYRQGQYGPWHAGEARADPEIFAKAKALRDKTPIDATVDDVPYFVDALTGGGATGSIGVVGYCMGGARALRAANALPRRIRAAASLHGGNLASDDAASPHRHIDQIAARLYIGSAGVDGSFPPEQAGLLSQTLRAAEIDHLMENYIGCAHGWTVPDNPIFHQQGAERHWARLETLFGETLS